MPRMPAPSLPPLRTGGGRSLPAGLVGAAVLAAGVGVAVTTGVGGRVLRGGRRALGLAAGALEEVTDALDDGAEALKQRVADVPVVGALAGALEEVTDALDDTAEALKERLGDS